MNILEKAISSAKIRLSGEIYRSIKDTERALQIICKAKSTATGNILSWLTWYEDSILLHKKRMQIYRCLPASFGSVKLVEMMGLNNKIPYPQEDNRIKVKEITLPNPIDESGFWQLKSPIFDVLTPYLLEDYLEKEELDELLPLIWKEGPYEYGNVLLAEGDIVIDAGSCVGDFSALASAKNCEVYAFEPVPHLFENYLSKTAKWNKNVKIFQNALSESEGEITFSVDENMGSSSAVLDSKRVVNKITVKATTVDDFVIQNNLPRIDFIKADIEGAERYMLKGAKNTLKEFAPKLAICTYHLPDDPEVLRDLILSANPKYVIEENYDKMFACVPK